MIIYNQAKNYSYLEHCGTSFLSYYYTLLLNYMN